MPRYFHIFISKMRIRHETAFLCSQLQEAFLKFLKKKHVSCWPFRGDKMGKQRSWIHPLKVKEWMNPLKSPEVCFSTPPASPAIFLADVPGVRALFFCEQPDFSFDHLYNVLKVLSLNQDCSFILHMFVF